MSQVGRATTSTAVKRKSDDKSNWRIDHLTTKRIKFRMFKGKENELPKTKERELKIVHMLDQPVPQQVSPDDIPSEEECKQHYLLEPDRSSVATTPRQQPQSVWEHLEQPKSVWEPDDDTSDEDEDDEDDEEVDDSDDEEDKELWHLESVVRPSSRQITRRKTQDASNWMPNDDRTLKIRNYSIRGYSPAARISEATQVTFAKIETKNVEKSDISPRSSRRGSRQSGRQEWEQRRPSLYETIASHNPSLAQDMMRRPSRPQDALHSHPVQIHVRQDSVTDPFCRVCHMGVAERWGVCQNCEDELSPTDVYHEGFAKQQQEHILAYRQGPKPAFNRHNSGGAVRNRRPPPLNQFTFSTPNRHRQTESVVSDPEANVGSEPSSPATRTVRTVMTLSQPDTPQTPMSELSTPEVYRRFEMELGRALLQCEREEIDRNGPRGPVGDRGYYFEDGSLKEGGPSRRESRAFGGKPYVCFRDGQRTASVLSREVNTFMLRKLSLSEYDGAFSPAQTSPECPGPGWI